MAEKKNPTKKERILSAARYLFVEQGYTGTSVGEIVAKADITHSLLFHHYKNKENLWQIVKNQVIEEGRAVQEHTPSLNLSFQDFLLELVFFATKFYETNPDVVRILNWQRLERNEDANIGLDHSEQSKRWFDACEHYKSTGEIDKTIPTDFVVSFVLSVTTSVALDQNRLLKDQKDKTAYINFLVGNMLASLKKNQTVSHKLAAVG